MVHTAARGGRRSFTSSISTRQTPLRCHLDVRFVSSCAVLESQENGSRTRETAFLARPPDISGVRTLAHDLRNEHLVVTAITDVSAGGAIRENSPSPQDRFRESRHGHGTRRIQRVGNPVGGRHRPEGHLCPDRFGRSRGVLLPPQRRLPKAVSGRELRHVAITHGRWSSGLLGRGDYDEEVRYCTLPLRPAVALKRVPFSLQAVDVFLARADRPGAGPANQRDPSGMLEDRSQISHPRPIGGSLRSPGG